MIFSSSSKDFFYTSASSALTYTLSVDGQTVYWGKAVNPSGIRINIGRRIADWLETHMPDFRGFDGEVVEHPRQMRVFNLYDDSGNMLESYTVLLDSDGSWTGGYAPLSQPINGHSDSRQKIFWTMMSETGETAEIIGWAPLAVEVEGDFVFPSEGGTFVLPFTSNAAFTVEETCDWLSVVKEGDTAGTLTIEVEENEDETERFCQIRMVQPDYVGTDCTQEGATVILSVGQDAFVPYLSIVSGQYKEFAFSGGTWAIEYETNCHAIRYEVSDGRSGFTSGNELVLSLPENSYATPVRYEVSFYYEDTLLGTSVAVVRQYAPYVEITSIPSILTSDRQLVDIGYATNCDGRVQYELYSAYTGDSYVLAKSGRTDSLTGISITIEGNVGDENVNYHLIIRVSNASSPSEWVASDEGYFSQKIDYSNQYLTFVPLERFGLALWSNDVDNPYLKNIEYSTDSGNTWTVLLTTRSGRTLNVVYFDEGTEIRLRGKIQNTGGYWLGGIRNGAPYYYGFGKCSGRFNAKGSVLSLVFGDDFRSHKNDTIPRMGFDNTFAGSGIVSAENLALPTNLGRQAYNGCFEGCTSLVNAPALPATTLAIDCYSLMFEGCTSLVSAPALPATTLATDCYVQMFYGCTSLVNAPVLPAQNLTDGCYERMFYGCSSLSALTCLAINTSASNCTLYWLNGAASSGTFTKAAGATWNRGESGIPTGWTVVDAV